MIILTLLFEIWFRIPDFEFGFRISILNFEFWFWTPNFDCEFQIMILNFILTFLF